MRIPFFLISLALCFSVFSQAPPIAGLDMILASTQTSSRIKMTEGTIFDLARVNLAGIVFDYSRMTVGNYQNLEEYLNSKKKFSESEKQKWRNMFKETLEPKFLELFEQNAINRDLYLRLVPDTSKTKVDLIIDVLKVSPEKQDFNNPDSQAPNVRFFYSFLDPQGNLVARFESIGFGPNRFDSKISLRECFAVAGKMLANEIYKQIKKEQR